MGKIMVIRSEICAGLPTDVLLTKRSIIQNVLEATERHHEWQERAEMETNPKFRQPIPYVVVRHTKSAEIVLMQRMKGQGEARLAGKLYIGAGGHVEEGHSVRYTAIKEATEELGLPLFSLEPVGIFITTGGPVEDVHLCCFYEAWTSYRDFTSPEGALHEPRWVDYIELQQRAGDMEKWSQVVVRDHLGLSKV